MALQYRDDPYSALNFEVVLTGVSPDGKSVKGSFKEVSGLDTTLDPIEYRNGSEDFTPRKIPGLKKFTNITLKRGLIGDLAFWNWVVQGLSGQVNRVEGYVALLDENRQEVMRWNFKRAWPCKWTGPALNAGDNQIAMETLEICHEGLEIDGQQG
jgi:phage tail-like protein